MDGKFFREFQDDEGKLYFSDKRNLGAILNIDWFQPFDDVENSTGVIYLALLNLPRDIRFKWENVFTVGVIDGPQEPKTDVSSFLKPFVDELLSMWNPGGLLNEDDSKANYKLALCCTSADLPATRKCCGFVSFNGNKGLFLDLTCILDRKESSIHENLTRNVLVLLDCLGYDFLIVEEVRILISNSIVLFIISSTSHQNCVHL